MNSILISVIVFVCVLGGALIGTLLHVKLPAHHRDGDAKDVIKLVMGLIANVFASYFLSHFIFEWVLGKRQAATLSI